MRLFTIFEFAGKPLLFSACILVAFLIGAIRFLTGPEYALSLFYLLPVIISSWYAGRRAGLVISFISASSWLLADLAMIERFESPLVPFINETFRLIVFIMISYLISELKKAIENQKSLARIDPLTFIANRRAFYEIADLELKKARRLCQPISVVYIDLDNFKVVNDRFGHDIGDRLLREVAICIKENLRDTDIVARFGGDEFCVLLAGASADAAYLVASKMNEILLNLMARQGWPVTFSIGVATFESPPESIDELVQQADQLMYHAKKRDRDKIRQGIISGI